MSKNENDIKDRIKEQIKDDNKKSDISKEVAVDSYDKDLAPHGKRMGAELSENQMFDLLELASYSLLQNLRRKDAINIMAQYLEEFGIGIDSYDKKSVSMHRMLTIYEKARRQLFTRNIEDIEKERNSYVRNMHRLALKAESSLDFGSAIKCLKEIATVTGIFDKVDDTAIVLNLVPVQVKPKE